jgi:hypothetical protein
MSKLPFKFDEIGYWSELKLEIVILISRYGVTADGKTIQVHGQHRPDVLFQLRGLRVVIEGKFSITRARRTLCCKTPASA